jgi:hypothetical protein
MLTCPGRVADIDCCQKDPQQKFAESLKSYAIR